MNQKTIVPIVEGRSEVESVPLLIRKIISCLGIYSISVAKPFLVKRNMVVKEGEIERAIKQALRTRQNPGGILVLLDADDDCPAELSADLLNRCRTETSLPVAVVIANKEYESWFLGAKESLRGKRGIKDDACAPSDPEGIRAAKERLEENMIGKKYVEVDDQPALTDAMDLLLARQNCASFDKFFRETESMLVQLSSS